MTHWFDDLVRGLASTTTTRRGILKLLAVGLATSVLGSERSRNVAAQTPACDFHTQCTSYYWNDDRTGSAWKRFECFENEELDNAGCRSRTPQGNVSLPPYIMVPGSPYTNVAEVYDGKCHKKVIWSRVSGVGGWSPIQHGDTFAFGDEADLEGDRFSSLSATLVGAETTMAKRLDGDAATTDLHDNRLPPACECEPPNYQLCGQCVSPFTTCAGQKYDCCYGGDQPGYWFAEGRICHACG